MLYFKMFYIFNSIFSPVLSTKYFSNFFINIISLLNFELSVSGKVFSGVIQK